MGSAAMPASAADDEDGDRNGGGDNGVAPAADGSQRLDKWLWFVRVIKSRTQAAGLVSEGKVRVNRDRTTKPSQTVRPGDVVTVTVRGRVRVLRVVAPGTRRGPPTEAQGLYEDLTPVVPQPDNGDRSPVAIPSGERDRGAGRPTKRDRRQLERFRRGE